MTLRLALNLDAGSIGRIYDEGIADGDATFATGQHDETERERWLAERGERAPVWVAQVGEDVVAWGALAPLSHRPWYDGVAEYTVYVSRHGRGRGVGKLLLDTLIAVAPSHDYWKLVGMILPENAAGLRLAESCGFREVGVHRAHARSDGRWRDVTILERHLEVEE